MQDGDLVPPGKPLLRPHPEGDAPCHAQYPIKAPETLRHTAVLGIGSYGPAG